MSYDWFRHCSRTNRINKKDIERRKKERMRDKEIEKRVEKCKEREEAFVLLHCLKQSCDIS